MVRLTLTLTSGVQVEYDTDDDEAAQLVAAVRRSWDRPEPPSGDVVLGAGTEVTDWVRVAHISAVRVEPLRRKGPEDDDTASG
jgi:hypothetical protein